MNINNNINFSNEINRVLYNIKNSGTLSNIFQVSNMPYGNLNGFVLSFCELINGSIKYFCYDKNSNGGIKPDIITYRVPNKIPHTNEDFLKAEREKETNFIGIEHFQVSHYSYLKNKRGKTKIVDIVKQRESYLLKRNNHFTVVLQLNNYNNYEKFTLCDEIISFAELYKKHCDSIIDYRKNIMENSYIGLKSKFEADRIPIIFLIEYDNFEYYDLFGNPVPFLFDEKIIHIIKMNYSENNIIPDAFICFSPLTLYFIDSNFFLSISNTKNLVSHKLFYIQQEYEYANGILCKKMPSYLKIVGNTNNKNQRSK